MTIVVVNPGTSSVKIGVYEHQENHLEETLRKTVSCDENNFCDILKNELSRVASSDTVFGIRVVHGGWMYHNPTRITDDVISYLHHVIPLAPLHLPLAIQTIQTIHEIYPDAQLFAVFDTQFHHTMPDKAKYYALPIHISRQYHIYRYGFHGLAYSSMLNLYTKHLRIPKDQATLIGIHLGSGCSMCAIKNGQSIETSMGFSPLEGLISRTRTGTIDPTVLVYLHNQTSQPIETLLDMFNKQAGLKGLSNTDGHIQNVLASQTPEAQQSLDMFVYRILLSIGAYDMILETQAPIVLSGGISEHARSIWEHLARHAYLGVTLSDISPDRLDRPFTEISTHESKRKMYVACIDEERKIAEHIKTTLLK